MNLASAINERQTGEAYLALGEPEIAQRQFNVAAQQFRSWYVVLTRRYSETFWEYGQVESRVYVINDKQTTIAGCIAQPSELMADAGRSAPDAIEFFRRDWNEHVNRMYFTVAYVDGMLVVAYRPELLKSLLITPNLPAGIPPGAIPSSPKAPAWEP